MPPFVLTTFLIDCRQAWAIHWPKHLLAGHTGATNAPLQTWRWPSSSSQSDYQLTPARPRTVITSKLEKREREGPPPKHPPFDAA
ncbi:hypothetical protein LZ31DRAFT_144696 [Colletotrichum somersetense]|nr:hypothetical protein LZ31DRAFT_144696 [Colletotrichum somersetense]